MKVGFLGFGEVASTMAEGLMASGVEVYVSIAGRSPRTRKIAEEMKVKICRDSVEVAEVSDILISAVVPARAVEVAREIGEHSKGIYVDINNVSPQTVKEALSYIENGKTADAALMGSIKKNGLEVQILASGSSAKEFAELNQYGLNIKVIGSEIGQASTLKMLRSSYTKGVSALLFESLYSAYRMGLDDILLECLENTECPGFKDSALSRITSSAYHAERRAQEMDEVLKMMSEYADPIMSKAAEEFFINLSKKLGKLEKRPKDYKDLFIRV